MSHKSYKIRICGSNARYSNSVPPPPNQPMPTTIYVQTTFAHPWDSHLGGLFRIQFDHHHSVIGYKGHKADEMIFCHLVFHGNVIIILNFFHVNGVVGILLIYGQGTEFSAAAGDLGISGAK